MSESKIVLGSAQFGMDYGVTNKEGQCSLESVKAIVERAIVGEINLIDTAPAYGDAEARLGRILAGSQGKLPRICSKLPSLSGVSKNSAEEFMRGSVIASLRKLQVGKLGILMFHDFDDLQRHGGYLLDLAYEMTLKGWCSTLGVSVYTPDQAITAMLDERIAHIQIPFNCLDQRWLSEDFLGAVTKRSDLEIHARSVFLQGLLLSEHEQWPSWYNAREKTCCEIDMLVERCEREDRMDLCLAYVSSFPWVKHIIVGVQSLNQFEQIMSRSRNKNLTAVQVGLIRNAFKNLPRRLIDPSKW